MREEGPDLAGTWVVSPGGSLGQRLSLRGALCAEPTKNNHKNNRKISRLFGGDFGGFAKGICQIFSRPRRTHSCASVYPKSGPKWGSGHGGDARGAVAENSVLVQFGAAGPKFFRRRWPPSWPGRPCPAGQPALHAGSPHTSRRVPAPSAERSSLRRRTAAVRRRATLSCYAQGTSGRSLGVYYHRNITSECPTPTQRARVQLVIIVLVGVVAQRVIRPKTLFDTSTSAGKNVTFGKMCP